MNAISSFLESCVGRVADPWTKNLPGSPYILSRNRTIYNSLQLKWVWDCVDGGYSGRIPDFATPGARR